MAIYFVASGGSNTSPYDTWAKAATSLATALAAASTDGDIVVVQYNAVPSGDTELSADTTYTAAAAITLLSASNDGGSAYTPTAMGTGNWIGNSTTNRGITLLGQLGKMFERRGLTFRTAGATADSIFFHSTSAGGYFSRDVGCYFWSGNTATTARINIGGATAGRQSFSEFVECTFRFGSTSQCIVPRNSANVRIIGGSVSGAGSAPTVLFDMATAQQGNVDVIGFDASAADSAVQIVNDVGTNSQPLVWFRECKFPASAVVLATQTQSAAIGSEVYLFDCQVGTTLGVSGYYNALGSMVTDTSIYYTSGPEAASWKLTTTAAANAQNPFRTPWIDWYQTGTSSITPRLEVLRDGSSTAYTDWELWSEWLVRVTGSSVLPTQYNDRAVSAGAAANQATGAGTGSWTGEGGTAWSGKLDTGTSVTPAAAGRLLARVSFAAASSTVYISPTPRTA